MYIMQDEVSVAANTISANQLSGLQFEFLDRPRPVRLYATGSATGLRVNFNIGGLNFINDSRISLQNRPPVVPDDFVLEVPVAVGRMLLTFRNTTGGALTAFWRVEIV